MPNCFRRFLRCFLTVFITAALLCPPPAHALRPTAPHENAGLEEEILRAISTGSEEEEESRALNSRLLLEFGGSLRETFRNFLPLRYGERPIVSSTQRYGVEQWGEKEVYWIRSGPLFFMEARRADSLSPALREDLGPRLIRVPDLQAYSISRLHDSGKGKFGSHTHATLMAVLHSDLKDHAVVDLGAGDGVLALAASRRGAGPLILVEHDPVQMEQARFLLIANELIEGKDFHLLDMDLKDVEGIAREVERWAGPGRKIALIMNVGTWPGLYDVSNAEGIALARRLPGVDRFIAGGYMGDTPREDWRWSPREAVPADQSALVSLGFQQDFNRDLRLNYASFFDPWSQMNAVAFSASRAAAGAEEKAADGAAWEPVPGSRIYVVPDEVIDTLMRQEPAVAAGLTVRPLPAASRRVQISLHWTALLVFLPRLSQFSEQDQEKVTQRLFTEGNILIRRSMDRGQLQEVLKHELVQRLAYPDPAVLETGIGALMKSEWKDLFLWLNQTEYAGRLSAEEFAGQWAQLADVFKDPESVRLNRREEWQKMKKDLQNAVEEKSSRVTPELARAVRRMDELSAKAEELTAAYVGPVLEGLDRNPLLSPQTLKQLPPEVMARMAERGRKRVSDDPQFIAMLSQMLFGFLASELSGQGRGEISAGQFFQWLAGKRILVLGDDPNSAFLQLLSEKYGVKNAVTVSRGRMALPWSQELGEFDVVLSVLGLNPTRVPSEPVSGRPMDPNTYWKLVAHETAESLAPGGMAVYVVAAGGNPDLEAAFSWKKNLNTSIRMNGSIYQVVGSAGGQTVGSVLGRIAREIQSPSAGAEESQRLFPTSETRVVPEIPFHWDGERYGAVLREAGLLKMAVYPDAALRKEVAIFQQREGAGSPDGHVPPLGSLGQVKFDFMQTDDGRLALLIDEIQPSGTFRDLSKELRGRDRLGGWTRGTVEKIAEWGNSQGFLVFGGSRQWIQARYPGLSDEEAQRYYTRSYDSPRWEMREVSMGNTYQTLKPKQLWAYRGNAFVEPPAEPQDFWLKKWFLGRLGFLPQGRFLYPFGWRGDPRSAGLEEPMSSLEFLKEFGPEAVAAAGPNGERALEWMERANARAVVYDLPSYLPLYVQGKQGTQYFWKAMDHFLAQPGNLFAIIPVDQDKQTWQDLGFILQDPEANPVDNPKGLPFRVVPENEIPGIQTVDVLAAVFRGRLGIPESQFLGALRFTDKQGRDRLVLFSAA